MEHKIFKNIEEQIALLSNDKGLIIDDVEYAKNCIIIDLVATLLLCAKMITFIRILSSAI